jgi:hypothetical protein
MGYVRSGLRQHWHVYGIIRDTSPDAFTPTLGYATQVVSVTVLIFFLLIGFVFWITSLHDRPEYVTSPGNVAPSGGRHGLGGAILPQPSAVTELRSLSERDVEGRAGLS